MSERKLASIQIISELKPIEGADKIEVALMKDLGWECVVKKDEFKIGDLVVYFEIDSVLPEIEPFEFLRNRKFRIRTIKLKGQVSQGLIFSTSLLPQSVPLVQGQDVTEVLGVTKYLSPSEENELKQEELKIKFEKNKLKRFMMRYSWFRRLFLSKKQKSGFPYWVAKTDEERIQNMPKVLEQFADKEVYVTEKIDYQSVTFTGKKINKFSGILSKLIPIKEYKFVVCSRNMATNDRGSLYWKIAEKYNIEKILRQNPSLTIQGEQGDTKVQGNKYSIAEPKLWVFNIINHDTKYHYNYEEMKEFCLNNGLTPVPLVTWESRKTTVPLYKIGSTVQEVVEFSKGKSAVNHRVDREGIVVRCIENGKKVFSFKVINPDFLLKYET